MLVPSIHPDLLYGYIPTTSVCSLFVALFSITTILHAVQASYYRLWWLFPTIVAGGLGEIIGWAGRLWSSKTFEGNDVQPYLMQISSTIIAPTPIVAANFVTLGFLISHLGRQYSRLSPRTYGLLFVFIDVAALIIQAVGGASASEALQTGIGDPNKGGHVMLGGIVLQLVAIVIYATLASEFFYHYHRKEPMREVAGPGNVMDVRIRHMVYGLALSTVCILIRAVYRTIELADGWAGRIIRTQVYFNVLDGAMIVIALFTLNITHPGRLLPHIIKHDRRESERKVATPSDIETGSKKINARETT